MQKGMSLMKNKLLKYTGAALLLLACSLTSCIKEDYAAADKASVQLTFTTRANGDNADPNAVEAGEGMKHLRVIVADQQSKVVRFNREFNVPDNATSHTVRFGDLYAGRTYDFYAIANEASFGGNFDNYVEGESLGDESALLNYQITADANTLITNGLPAAGKASHSVTATENQSLTIEMQRAVAKARVNFVNETGTEQTITDVKLLKVGAAETVLFPRAADATLPAATQDLTLSNSVTIANDATVSTPTSYFYESSAPTGGYVLEAMWNGTKKVLELNNAEIENQILRNKFLNITITLKVNDWKLEYEVLPWEDNEVSLDFTDILSYTSAGWSSSSIMNLL